MEEEAATGGALGALMDGVIWFVTNLFMSFYNFFFAITQPSLWLDWSV